MVTWDDYVDDAHTLAELAQAQHPGRPLVLVATTEGAREAGVKVMEVQAEAGAPIVRLADHVAMVDFAATYLAIGLGLDPGIALGDRAVGAAATNNVVLTTYLTAQPDPQRLRDHRGESLRVGAVQDVEVLAVVEAGAAQEVRRGHQRGAVVVQDLFDLHGRAFPSRQDPAWAGPAAHGIGGPAPPRPRRRAACDNGPMTTSPASDTAEAMASRAWCGWLMSPA